MITSLLYRTDDVRSDIFVKIRDKKNYLFIGLFELEYTKLLRVFTYVFI
jgi:hypothetical protein